MTHRGASRAELDAFRNCKQAALRRIEPGASCTTVSLRQLRALLSAFRICKSMSADGVVEYSEERESSDEGCERRDAHSHLSD